MKTRRAFTWASVAAVAVAVCAGAAFAEEGDGARRLKLIRATRPVYRAKDHAAWAQKGRLLGFAPKAPAFKVLLTAPGKHKILGRADVPAGEGVYEFGWISPGTYRLDVTAKGYRALTLKDVKIKARSDVYINLDFGPAAEDGERREVDGDRGHAEERHDGDREHHKGDGPRDGEGKREGPRDGEAKHEGPRDGEGKREGPRDGEGKREGPRDGEGGEKAERARGTLVGTVVGLRPDGFTLKLTRVLGSNGRDAPKSRGILGKSVRIRFRKDRQGRRRAGDEMSGWLQRCRRDGSAVHVQVRTERGVGLVADRIRAIRRDGDKKRREREGRHDGDRERHDGDREG